MHSSKSWGVWKYVGYEIRVPEHIADYKGGNQLQMN